MVSRGRLWLAIAVLIGCAACTQNGEPVAQEEVQRVVLDGTEWVLVSLDGSEVIPGTRVSLEFTAEGAGGYSGCNWYGARFRSLTDSTLDLEPATSTARGCLAPGVTEQEIGYQTALSEARSYHTRGGRLELVDPSGRVRLVFDPRAKLAQDPEQLVGTSWRLRSVSPGLGPADTTVTISFGSGTATGFGGCRDYASTYQARGDLIFVTSTTMRALECDRGLDAGQREGQFTTDLSEATYWTLTPGRLELITHGGRKLEFEAVGRR